MERYHVETLLNTPGNYADLNWEDILIYKDMEIPAAFLFDHIVKSEGLSWTKKTELLCAAVDEGIVLTNRFVRELYRAEHKNKADKLIGKFKAFGELKCKYQHGESLVPVLEESFKNDKRFKGRVPGIVREMAAVCGYYRVPVEDMVSRFSIQPVKTLKNAGLGSAEAALLCAVLPSDKLAVVTNHPDKAHYVSKLIGKARDPKSECVRSRERYMNAALWVCDHLQTDEGMINKVVKNAEYIRITPNLSVDAVEVLLDRVKSVSEIKKIEKAYKKPGFKFSDCRCDLRMSAIECGKYGARILQANDPMQVMLGYATDCCQYLGEAGESSMMHGLINPKAGFWVLTNINSGKILAQAEVWEENEDTLVFDNIEFANDADIALYREAIGAWVRNSSYPNIKMGMGYNEMVHEVYEGGSLRSCGRCIPPVTPYEIFVMSYEEDAEWEGKPFKNEEEARQALENGDVTYFDFVYCDSENQSVWMKENGVVEPYFNHAEDREEEQEGPELD